MSGPVRPSGTLTLAGQEYKLPGSFETLAAVEEAVQVDILQVSARIPEMRVGQIARIIATATGLPERKVGGLLVDEIGVTSAEYQRVKGQLMAWLFVCLAPKAEREAKAKEVGEWLAGIETPPDSPGKSTRKSA